MFRREDGKMLLNENRSENTDNKVVVVGILSYENSCD